MREQVMKELRDRLQQERRALIEAARDSNKSLNFMSEDQEPELEEEGQQDRDSDLLEHLEEHDQTRIAEIDAALGRMDAGAWGRCERCGKEISEERLRAMPTTTLCEACSSEASGPRVESEETDEIIPEQGRLPPRRICKTSMMTSSW